MSVIYRVVADGRPVAFTVTPPATGTPTVTLYNDQAETVPHGGTAPTVSGAGSNWQYDLTPAALPAGTFYAKISAPTAGGTAIAHDTLIITAAVIITGTSNVLPQDVADLMPQRVLTQDGNPASTFSLTTVPTDTQVTRLIALVDAEVTGGLGTIPEPLAGLLHTTVALGTAVLLLATYFEGSAAYDDLNGRYQQAREQLRDAIEAYITTGDPNAVSTGDDPGAGGERIPVARGAFPTIFNDQFTGTIPVTTLHEPY